MCKVNKGKKLIALLLVTAIMMCSFPAVYAEEPVADIPAEDVTPAAETAPEEVTVPVPTEEPAEEPTEAPTEEPTAEPTEEPAEEPAPEATPEPTPEPIVIEVDPSEVTEPEIVPSPDETEEPEEISDEPETSYDDESEFGDDGDMLYEIDDDDQGFVSEELLEQFNDPATFETVEFSGNADIVLRNESYAYGQEITLVAKVTGVELSYRIVWEANDNDDRGWYTVANGMEYSFIVTEDIMERGYRVVLYAVD